MVRVQPPRRMNKKKDYIMPIKNSTDTWSSKKSKLEALSAEQAAADIALVEAERALDVATQAHAAAAYKASNAEKKLAAFRANLGRE